MKGLASLLRSSSGEVSHIRRGLVILACTDVHKKGIVARVTSWMPHVQWTILQRDTLGYETHTDEMILSKDAVGPMQQLSFLRSIRRRSFDVAVVSWTGEPSYGALKTLAFLSGARNILVCNENYDAYFLARNNWRIVRSHIVWRLERSHGKGLLTTGLGVLSWLILFPLGVIGILAKTTILELSKRARTK